MVEYDKDLSWKNHTPFFINLNKDMDNLRQISRLAKDFTKLPIYYEELENMCFHYACYLDDSVFKDLNKIKEVIMTLKYKKFLTKQLDEQQYQSFYKEALDSINNLRLLHAKFSKSLHDNQLFPKVIEKEKKNKNRSLHG